MKITLSQPELSRAAGLAGNVVPSKSTLPILSTLLIRADKEGVAFSATDLDVSIHLRVEAAVEKTGAVAVPARRFAEIVRKLDSVDVTLTVEDQTLLIECGRSRFQISTMDPADFPKLPDTKGLDTFTAAAGTIRGMVRRTRYAISQDLARPSMNGIFLEIDGEKTTMVATDGHRLAYCQREEKLDVASSYGVIVPGKALDQLLRLLPDEGDMEIGISESQAFFRTGAVTLFSRLIEGPFPNYKQVIPQGNEKEMTVATDSLLMATDRVSTLASTLNTRQVKLVLEPDQLVLEVASPDIGKAHEEMEAAYGGEPMAIGYNAVYLLDVLKNMDSDQVRFRLDRPDNAGIIEPVEERAGERYFCLLMPLKLSD
ncbi:MAG: DNA polymerase III subunit beta [Candidatus Krumholzibacteriota bacterium]|nr:DNA polymerase III subunit beta [Candidatus Krumholzibacteriota bacterium]